MLQVEQKKDKIFFFKGPKTDQENVWTSPCDTYQTLNFRDCKIIPDLKATRNNQNWLCLDEVEIVDISPNILDTIEQRKTSEWILETNVFDFPDKAIDLRCKIQ